MHVEHFAPQFPNIVFQPSDIDKRLLDSIEEIANECPTKNICQPMLIDIQKPYTEWGKNTSSKGPFLNGDCHSDFKEYKNSFDYMLNINMIHISEFSCTEGLFQNAGQLLKDKGLLITYGPYANNGVLEPESNIQFDKSLRAQNPEWGIRDVVKLQEVASKNGINLKECVNMPANNKCLIWQKGI